MGTTLIIVELVIIGLQVLAWVGLLLWPVLGRECISLDQLKDWVSVVAIGVLGVSYTLGIVFDRSVGLLTSMLHNFYPWFRKFRTSKPSDSTHDEPGNKESDIMLYHAEAHKHLEDLSRQRRLLRATFFNAVIIAFLIPFRCDVPCVNRWLLVPLVVAAFLAFLTWFSSYTAYSHAVKYLHKKIEKLKKDGTGCIHELIDADRANHQ